MLVRVTQHAVILFPKLSVSVPTLFVVKRGIQVMVLHNLCVVLQIHFVVARICVVLMIWRVATIMVKFLVAIAVSGFSSQRYYHGQSGFGKCARGPSEG